MEAARNMGVEVVWTEYEWRVWVYENANMRIHRGSCDRISEQVAIASTLQVVLIKGSEPIYRQMRSGQLRAWRRFVQDAGIEDFGGRLSHFMGRRWWVGMVGFHSCIIDFLR